MIKQLDIYNFQSHKESHLDFHPGVNVLIGSSDAGKSAIIRAIRWAVWNRPNSDSFRSWWGGETATVLYLPEGRVSRTKTNSINRYCIESSSKDFPVDGLTFEAFKTEVPEEVIQILNMDEVNLQRQFARAFLLDSSPGEVAQHFNRVANLDKIDVANRNVASWMRSIQRDVEVRQQQLEDFETEMLKYQGLEELEGRLTELEALQRTQNKYTATKTQMSKTVYEIRVADVEISRHEKILGMEPEVDRVLDLFAQRTNGIMQRGILNGKIISYQSLTDQITQYETVLNLEPEVNRIQGLMEHRKTAEANKGLIRDRIVQASGVKQQIDQLEVTLAVESDVDRILNWVSDRDILKERVTEIRDILRTIRGTNMDIERQIEWMDQAQREFYAEFPDECPLCGKPK